MPTASRADLRKAFCSYCGYPPMGPWRLRTHRVCMRCQMGMVLRAPPNAQPRFDEPFLIVDERLIVQAISRRAERLLMVNEPDGFGVPLAEFLVSANGDANALRLALMVKQAIGGDATPGSLELRAVRDPAIRLMGRVVGCGPPAAALLILGAPKPDLQRSSNGFRSGKSKHRLPVHPAGLATRERAALRSRRLEGSDHQRLDQLIASFARAINSDVTLLCQPGGKGQPPVVACSRALGAARESAARQVGSENATRASAA